MAAPGRHGEEGHREPFVGHATRGHLWHLRRQVQQTADAPLGGVREGRRPGCALALQQRTSEGPWTRPAPDGIGIPPGVRESFTGVFARGSLPICG